MRRLLLGAAALVVAGATTACGAPTDASKADFCDAVEKVSKNADDYDEARDAALDLGDVGTPEGISDDAREGFEISIDAFDEAEDEKDLDKAQDDLSSDDKKKVEAFSSYIDKTCGSEGD
jgi:hypothetical protein